MSTTASAEGLCEFIDASPSPFHVCVTVAQRLTRRGVHRTLRDATRGRAGRLLHRAGGFAGGVAVRRGRPRRAVPDRRRPHRQPQPAGQATSRPVRLGLAGGRAAALRRGVAELVAGPRPRHQRPAFGAGRQHHRPPAGPHRRTDPAGATAGDPPGRGPQGASRWIRSGTSTRSGASAAAPGRSWPTSPSGRASTPPTCSAPT